MHKTMCSLFEKKEGKVGKTLGVQKPFHESCCLGFQILQNTKPFLFMDQEDLFQAVKDRDTDVIFIADFRDRDAIGKIISQNHKDHRQGIRQIWDNKISQQGMGMPTRAKNPWDCEFEDLCMPIQEVDEIALVGTVHAALPNGATKRTHFLPQTRLVQTSLKKGSNRR